MWLVALILSVALISFLVTFTITNRIQSRHIELEEMNTLYICDTCGKFHRRYQEELQQLIDPKYKSYLTCPNCYSSTRIYTDPEFSWMKTNPECPELDKHDLKKVKKAMKKTKQLLLEDQSIDQFLHYYKLHNNKNSDNNILK